MPSYDYDKARQIFYKQTSKTSAGRKLAEGTREIERRKKQRKKKRYFKEDETEETVEEEVIEEEPEPDVEREIEKVDHRVGQFYTKPAYEQYWKTWYYKGIETYQSIEPTKFYNVEGREGEIYGHSLRQEIKTQWIEPSYKALMESKHIGKDTEIFRTYDGFEFRETTSEPGPSLGGFGSYFLNIGDYAWSSLTGETWSPGKPVESPTMRKTRISNYQRDVVAWEKADVLHFGGKIISNPYTMALISYGLGYGLETFKMTKFGQKKLFDIGLFEQKIGSAPKWTYKYTRTVTPSGLVETGIGTGFGSGLIYGGFQAYKQNRLGEYVGRAGMLFPFVYYPYKWGRISGRTGFQRRTEMSTLRDPVSRIRQKAGYDLIDETFKLGKPHGYGDFPYDLRDIRSVGGKQADIFGRMIDRGGGAFWTGSGPMKAQYRYLFRTGRQPPGTLWRYSRGRYTGLGKPEIPTVPHDIDIYFLTKTANLWKSILRTEGIKGFDVHPYSGYSIFGKELPFGRYSGQYVELGVITQPPIKTTVLLRGTTGAKEINVWSINPKEQFMRMTRNLLPSKSIEFGHRSIKDVSTWTDTSFMLKQTAHKGWLDAYTRFSFPEQYLDTLKPGVINKIIKPTLGEKIVTKLGGLGTEKLSPITTYGKLGYKDFYIPFSYNYPKIITSDKYYLKSYDKPYKIPYPPQIKTITRRETFVWKSSLPFHRHDYKTPKVDTKQPPYPKPVMTIPKLPPTSGYKTKKSKFRPIPPTPRLKIPMLEERRPKQKRKPDPFGLGYKFRMFEPTKFKYVSPFKQNKRKKRRKLPF